MPTHQRILEAAFAAFTEHGFTNTSTLEIATRAHVSKRELYTLFGNKQDMLVACITSYAQRLRPPPDLPSPSTRPELATALTTYATHLLRELTSPTVVAISRLAIAEATSTPAIAQTVEQQARAPIRAALVEFFSVARDRQLLSGDPAEMADVFSSQLWGNLFVSLLFGVTKPPTRTQIETRARTATDAMLRLYAPKRS